MKFVRRYGDRYVFDLEDTERDGLCWLLKQFPSVPVPYHRISRKLSSEELAGEQEMLEDSMESIQAAHRERVAGLIASRRRFRKAGKRLRISLRSGEMDWLLQVLNDVRVGAWIKLGRPDACCLPDPPFTAETMRQIGSMELAGLFESQLLAALNR